MSNEVAEAVTSSDEGESWPEPVPMKPAKEQLSCMFFSNHSSLTVETKSVGWVPEHKPAADKLGAGFECTPVSFANDKRDSNIPVPSSWLRKLSSSGHDFESTFLRFAKGKRD